MSKNEKDVVDISSIELSDYSYKPYYNRLNLPPKPVIVSDKPSKVQISPLDAKSPQEVLEQHGMYKEDSVYSKHPEKIYADLSQFGDYESNLRAVRLMQEKFDTLDVDVRARFNHDVNEFTKYVTSGDFDIAKVLTDKELSVYKDYKADQEAQAEYQRYIKSDEYKALLEEQAMQKAFQQAQYEEWKKNFKKT